MKYFEFYNPVKICAGEDAVMHLNFELENLGVHKPLLLSDEGLKKLGMVEKLVKISGIEDYVLYTDIPADSGVEVVNNILKHLILNKCDGIIALGGGSVIDTAKGVKMSYMRTTNISDLMGLEVISKAKELPFIALPTTAGTGSEVTNVAVIKDEKSNVKMEFITPYLMPNVVILDAILTETLPPKITASTAVDALCHAIEGYTCLQKNPISDAYARVAIKLIFENLVKTIENPKDKDLRNNMAIASTLAGLAFGNSMVGGVHAIGHALGSVCHIAHGDAMAILLPYVMDYNKDKLENLYAELLEVIAPYEGYMNLSVSQKCGLTIRYIKDLLRVLNEKTGLCINLSQTEKYRSEDARVIAEGAINDGAIMVNPKQMNIEDIVEILKRAE